MCVYVCVYIYIYRERERYICIYVCVYIYIYIHIHVCLIVISTHIHKHTYYEPKHLNTRVSQIQLMSQNISKTEGAEKLSQIIGTMRTHGSFLIRIVSNRAKL